jgi:hypothetical protein
MIVPMHTREVAAAAAGCVLFAALAACAAVPARDAAAVAEAAPLRVMVKLVHGSEDAAAIGAEATRIAGVPVTYAAATSPTWHALALHCASTAECDAAIARLRAAGAVYQIVELEGRKTRSSS